MHPLDPPDELSPEDALEEEAEYQAWKARRLAERAATRQRIDSREGLVRLGTRPQAEVRQAVRRSVPTFASARRLFDLVLERLGDQASLDAWATPTERCMLLHDPERPGWLLPQRLLYLQARPPGQAEPQGIPISINVPPRLKRFAERFTKEVLDVEEPPRPPRDEPPTLPAGGQPGVLQILDGPATLALTYGEGGVLRACSCQSGDLHAFADGDSQPFTLDPFARPPQVGPPRFMLRPELAPSGVALETLADLVVEMRALERHAGRVMVPCDQPGTVQGTWSRALSTLRRAAWEGRLPEGPGWVVVDGWNGTALASGATFDEAVAAWKAQVARVQPLPPVEAPPPPEPEALEEEEEEEDSDSAGAELAHLPPPLPDGVAVASTGLIELRIEPPVRLDWPPPRPENVAAAALPLPPPPAIPEALAARGFDRVLPLLGEQGQVAFTFLRRDPDGYTAIGDDALAALDLDSLEADLDALFATQVEEHVDVWGTGNPYIASEYPVMCLRYHAWDDLGRSPDLRTAGASWGREDSLRSWDLVHRHQVVRVRVRG